MSCKTGKKKQGLFVASEASHVHPVLMPELHVRFDIDSTDSEDLPSATIRLFCDSEAGGSRSQCFALIFPPQPVFFLPAARLWFYLKEN